MSSDVEVVEKELGQAGDLSMDEFLRTLVGQMFENDNDTSYLQATLTGDDGTESNLEFEVRVTSINGIRTRDEDNS